MSLIITPIHKHPKVIPVIPAASNQKGKIRNDSG
jgi:hypothetical protein